MEYKRHTYGGRTFIEHCGFSLIALTAIIGSWILMFLSHLTGQSWINFFVADMALLLSGTILIAYAKLPAYQAGRFFTFGINSVPANRSAFYRWGWRLVLSGVLLSLCLLLPKSP